MTEENRIDFDIKKPFAVTRMEVPLPKFNTGDKVFYVNWDGDVTEREIDEVQYHLTLCNNGYVNFAKYEITYSFVEGGFRDTNKEGDMFENKTDAETRSIQRKAEVEQIRKQSRKEHIEKLLNELHSLLNDKEN